MMSVGMGGKGSHGTGTNLNGLGEVVQGLFGGGVLLPPPPPPF